MRTYFFKVTSLIKLLRMLFLVALTLCYSNNSAHAQNSQQDYTLLAGSVLGFLGVSFLTQQSAISANSAGKLNSAELIEAKEELLQYHADGQLTINEKRFKNEFPLLAIYLKNLKRESPEFRNLSRNELLEIANWRLLKKRPNE